MRLPRIMIAATGSGCGKTTVTLGLLRALVDRGRRPLACKTGPDYLDPLLHTALLGVPSENLDGFFSDDAGLVRTMVRAARAEACDGAVIESAMGYYDGIACSSEASAYQVARATATPVLLLVDGRNRGRSLAAEVMGFARYRADSGIAGVVFNRVRGAYYDRLAREVERECGVRVFGCVPNLPDCAIESRYLGLVSPDEVDDLSARTERIARALEDAVDVSALMDLAATAPVLDGPAAAVSDAGRAAAAADADERVIVREGACDAHGAPAESQGEGTAVAGAESVGDSAAAAADASAPVVAVARDQAFSFYYADTFRALRERGCVVRFFSPLSDDALPAGTCGLYLGGGYPERWARELSENATMRTAIARAISAGLPTIAECGGFLYLHRTLADADGTAYPQVGVIDADARHGGRSRRFGYVTLTSRTDSLLAARGATLRAHEFHYWESSDPGNAFAARKPQSDVAWEACHAMPTLYAGFPHLHLGTEPAALGRFVAACRAYAEQAKAKDGDANGRGASRAGADAVAGAAVHGARHVPGRAASAASAGADAHACGHASANGGERA
ncbi:MAG: cobyrinate a,c-diamide synthase [Eggerthellaceae bacterium]|jgi:cobyrinic acid a,c-diamide synthase